MATEPLTWLSGLAQSQFCIPISHLIASQNPNIPSHPSHTTSYHPILLIPSHHQSSRSARQPPPRRPSSLKGGNQGASPAPPPPAPLPAACEGPHPSICTSAPTACQGSVLCPRAWAVCCPLRRWSWQRSDEAGPGRVSHQPASPTSWWPGRKCPPWGVARKRRAAFW